MYFYMKLTKVFWLCKLGVLLFFVLLTLGLKLDAPWLIWTSVLVLGASALGFQLGYRCPFCHKVLDSRKLTPAKTCPRCGRNLEDM